MKYTVSGMVTISVYTTVEASSSEEAIEIAEGRDMQRLCHHCASADSEDQWATNGELDGTPFDLTAEKSKR